MHDGGAQGILMRSLDFDDMHTDSLQSQVDYEKLAAACGMTNPRSASNAWAAIKKKILAKANTTKGDGEDSTPKPTPKSTPGSKRKKKADTDADADDEQTSVKKSKAKGKGVKTKSEAKVDEKIDDGEAESAPGEERGGRRLDLASEMENQSTMKCSCRPSGLTQAIEHEDTGCEMGFQ